jgi:hypothetical protein
MIDPLALDIVNALSEDPLALKAGGSGIGSEDFGALMAGDPGTLLSGTPVNIEAAAILDLADQAVTESSLVSGSIANVAAATIELSPEALAQAAAAGLPATLSDDTPAFPRSFEARRLNPNGGVLPVTGLDHWQAAIEMFKHNGSSASNQDLPAPVPRICPFCGKIHTIFVGEDSLSASEESCAAYAALLAEQNRSSE